MQTSEFQHKTASIKLTVIFVHMEYTDEQIREIAKIGFVAKKPFESVPISNKVRELVKTFKSESKNYSKIVKKSKNNKFRPINQYWLKGSKNGSVIESTGHCDGQT